MARTKSQTHFRYVFTSHTNIIANCSSVLPVLRNASAHSRCLYCVFSGSNRSSRRLFHRYVKIATPTPKHDLTFRSNLSSSTPGLMLSSSHRTFLAIAGVTEGTRNMKNVRNHKKQRTIIFTNVLLDYFQIYDISNEK